METLDLLNSAQWLRYFPENSLQAILAEHVWEHLTLEQGKAAAATCFRFLEPNGYLRIAVPDAYHPSADYREWVKPGGSGAGAHDHKVLYNHQSLTDMLTRIGFVVQPLEYFDERGQFHANEWRKEDGLVERSHRFDERNRDGVLRYTSIILDAVKPDINP